eukprot:scaffold2967_cov128-Cylindrotheca_fusiformis.AAC.2
MSTPASTRSFARSLSSGRVPIAAPHSSCLFTESFDALGCQLRTTPRSISVELSDSLPACFTPTP